MSSQTQTTYYCVPEGESGRFAQDFGRYFDTISDDPDILFRSGSAILILKPNAKGKDIYEERVKQLQDVGHRLIISSISRLAIVSEYYHPEFFPDRYTFLNKVEDLRPEMRYLHFYATRIFQTQFDDVQLRILRKSTHVVDSDGEDLRSEVINVMRFQSYGIPIKIKPTLNFYRLIELIIQGRNRRKIVHKFDELADVFTNVAVLNVVIGCLARWLAFRANRLHFEKSIPGKLTQAGSRTFLPGALLRCIHFAHHSTLPPDVCFSVILHMLDGGRTEYPPVELDWRAHMRSIRAAKNRRTAP